MNHHLFKNPIRLENDRVLLIPFGDQRRAELRAVIFDDEIWEYMGMLVQSEIDFIHYTNKTLEDQEKGICYPFLIIDKRNNRVAGSTRYGYINIPNEKCEIGWTWYGKAFQGTGLNKACKYELLKFGFEQVGFRRIQFSVDQMNLRSQKAVEKLGAQKEGLFRNNYINSLGESRNDVYYSIIHEDWERLKKEVFKEFET